MKFESLLSIILILFALLIHCIKCNAFSYDKNKELYKKTSISSYYKLTTKNDGYYYYYGAKLYVDDVVIQLDNESYYKVKKEKNGYNTDNSYSCINLSGLMTIYTTNNLKKYINKISILFAETATLSPPQITEINTEVSFTLPYYLEITNVWTINNYTAYFINKGISTGIDFLEIITEDNPTTKINDITYKLKMDTKTWIATSFDSIQTYCRLSDSISYGAYKYPVQSIEKEFCKSNTHLNEIYIPKSIKEIGRDAFDRCQNLEKIHIDDIASWCTIIFENITSNPLYNGGKLFVGDSVIKDLFFDEIVSSIGKFVFAGCSSIKTVTFTDRIKSIGQNAFINCDNLQKTYNSNPIPIDIEDNTFGSTTYNGELIVPRESMSTYKTSSNWSNFWKISAFDGPDCDFEYEGLYYNIIDIKKRTCEVTYDNQYYHSYLQKEINVPDIARCKEQDFKVIRISHDAFNGSRNLYKLSLPKTIETIDENAFDGCINLKEIRVPNTIQQVKSKLSSLMVINVIFGGEGTIIPNWFKNNISVKSITFDCPNLSEISDSAFYGCCSLTDITLPSHVTTIKDHAFHGCTNIKEFETPKNLSDIGVSAFNSCTSLASIKLTSPLEYIPSYGFANCTSLKNVDLGSNIKIIHNSAFEGSTALDSLTIPNSVYTISNNVFSKCAGLQTITINDSEDPIMLGVNEEHGIQKGLFSSCQLKNVYIGRNILGQSPFEKNKSIVSLSIGHQVTDFPDNSLTDNPQLSTLFLGNQLDTIPSFNKCLNIKELTIGSHIKNIPDFSACSSFNKITVFSAKPQPLEKEFTNKVYIDCTLSVPKGSINSYKEAEGWKNFFNISEYSPQNMAKSLKMNRDKITLFCKDSLTLQPIVMPLDASEVFNWTSSNESVVYVNKYGDIKALKQGKAKVTAMTTDGTNLSATCEITVINDKVVTDLKLDKDSCTITIGENTTIKATIKPSDATHQDLKWTSSDEKIATITEEGIVHANNLGSCVVTATTTDETNISKSCKIVVVPIYITKLDIVCDSNRIINGNTMQLIVKFEPEKATITDFKWTVSDSTVVKVDMNGLAYGLSPGKATVYVEATDGSKLVANKEFEILPIVATNIMAGANQETGIINLNWFAENHVKNLVDYNIYYSKDNQPFVLWMPNTTKKQATFKGKPGSTYKFTVTARDKAGNRESYDENKCATITIDNGNE